MRIGARRLGLSIFGLLAMFTASHGGALAEPLPKPAPGVPNPKPAVWGFADLHTHPAAHMAFGADDDGTGGIFYGKPGMKLEDATMATDLAACDREKHGKFDADLVRHETRQMIMQKINQITGATHGSSGWPDFKTWPNARTTNHQQMHVQWLKRAYDGGLRVLVASAVENLSFRTLWRNGFNLAPPSVHANKADEFASAVRQIEYIHRLVAANSSWMQIVKSSAEARTAIQNNKLAVILGTELDTLTADQLIQLKNQQDVRVVIPAHTVDSPIAGAAVYEPLFNSHQWFMNGDFFHVVGDPLLKARLDRPSYLRVEGSIAIWDGPGAFKPEAIKDPQYCPLLYQCCAAPNYYKDCIDPPTGHKNAKGITDDAAFKRLMREGLLIDLAHMSDLGHGTAVSIASQLKYPMMDSHTSMREDGKPAQNERAIRQSYMKTLGALGGVLGLGTGGITAGGEIDAQRVFTIDGWNDNTDRKHRMVRFTGEQHDAVFSIGPYTNGTSGESCANASITIKTGGDDLRGGDDNATLVFQLPKTQASVDLNHRASWANGSVHTTSVTLPTGTRLADIRGVSLQHTGGTQSDQAGSDNWNVDEITIDCTGPGSTVLDAHGAPVMRFTGDNKTWRAPLNGSGTAEVRALHFRIVTGGDDLRGGNDNAIATIDLGTRTVDCALNRGENWGNNSTHDVRCDLPAGTRASSLKEVRIRTTFSGGLNGDNWNMDGITVTIETPATRLLAQSGSPLIRFKAEQRRRELYAPVRSPAADPWSHEAAASTLKLWVWTTTDDLRGENDNATVLFEMRDGSTQECPLNNGGKWDGGSSDKESHYNVMIRLKNGKTWSDIRNVRIRTNFKGGLTSDNWDIGQLSLEAYPDPVKAWAHEMDEAQSIVGNGRVALGTDLNGLAPQIPMTTAAPTGAFTYPKEISPPGRSVSLPNSRAGNRTFEFARDGIAHVGMLPDFMYVAAKQAGAQKIAPLFRSAEAVLEMWEKVEAVAPNVR